MKFDPNNYDPATDSSVDTDDLRAIEGPDAPEDNPGYEGVILITAHVDGDQLIRTCQCGCGGSNPEIAKSKRDFLQGHDARYKGILIRAHVTGNDVNLVGGSSISGSAMTFAEDRGWGHYLTAAAERATEKANKPARKPRAEKKVRLVEIKVGRWTYKATETSDGFAYTDGKGKLRVIDAAKATVIGEVGA